MVAEHKKVKVDFAKKVGLSAADVGSQLRSLKRRWMDDALSAAWMNIHIAAIFVSGHPDLAASRHNAIICGSPAMKQWVKAELPVATSLLPKIHSYILVSQGETGIRPKSAPKRLPPDMHGRRVACTAELTRLFEEWSGAAIGPRFPWGTIPAFLIRHRLHISNWPSKSEFPSVLGLVVSSVRTEHWTSMWNRLFAVDEQKRLVVKRLDVPGNEDLPDSTCLVKDTNNSTLLVSDWDGDISKRKSAAKDSSAVSDGVGTSGERAREAEVGTNPKKRRKTKDVSESTSGKGRKRRKVVSNSIIDEDESPRPSFTDEGNEHPQPSSVNPTALAHLSSPVLTPSSISALPSPALSGAFGPIPMPGAMVDPTSLIYNFDFDEQLHFDMHDFETHNSATNSLNPNPHNLSANSLDLFSQFPGLDMSKNQDLLLQHHH
jgi:hypothetical protein